MYRVPWKCSRLAKIFTISKPENFLLLIKAISAVFVCAPAKDQKAIGYTSFYSRFYKRLYGPLTLPLQSNVSEHICASRVGLGCTYIPTNSSACHWEGTLIILSRPYRHSPRRLHPLQHLVRYNFSRRLWKISIQWWVKSQTNYYWNIYYLDHFELLVKSLSFQTFFIFWV